MSNAITINAVEFSKAANSIFKGKDKELHDGMEGILFKNAKALELQAKQRAPNNDGGLVNSISAPVNTGDLEFTISVNKFYASFQEFGTGKYAAQYVSTLPQDWQQYAATFRSKKGNEGFDKFLDNMRIWCEKHSIPQSAAYPICLKILRDGVRPQPYIYPAYEYIRPFILKDVDTLLKKLSER